MYVSVNQIVPKFGQAGKFCSRIGTVGIYWYIVWARLETA